MQARAHPRPWIPPALRDGNDLLRGVGVQKAAIPARAAAGESITRTAHYGMYITVSYKSFHPGFVDSMSRIFQARFHFL